MLKKILSKRVLKPEGNAKEMLTLELAEIREISEKLFSRLDEKIKTLKSLEARVDKKADAIEKLLARAENIRLSLENPQVSRYQEIAALADNGLKVDEIAGILGIPQGEVELILDLLK